MGYTVNPVELETAAGKAEQAAGPLALGPEGARKVDEIASRLRYQPAAGMAEAVADKSGKSLQEAATILGAMANGLRVAAANYRNADGSVSAGMGTAEGSRRETAPR